MPPKRKQPELPPSPPGRVTRSAASSAKRVTRSAAAVSGSKLFSGELPPTRKTKKAKQEEAPPTKPSAASSDKPSASASASASSSASGSKKIIIIERCDQSDLFKTKANEVKEAIEQTVPGIAVIVNPKKPRKGCFEVRGEGGEIFVSLVKLKDPFDELKDVDISSIISDITAKIDGSDIAAKIGNLAIKQE